MNERQQMLEAYMARQLYRLANDANEGRVRAQLANLRRGIGRKPGDLPELWGLLFAEMSEEMMSRSGEPTREEWAIYTALTLYAQHQQGKNIREKSMHCREDAGRLGYAISRLVSSEEERERIARRFNAFATAKDMQEVAYYLRGLIQLLRAEDIPLDYVRLARDLYEFQSPIFAPGVRLRWGQDFYRLRQNEDTDNKEGKANDHA